MLRWHNSGDNWCCGPFWQGDTGSDFEDLEDVAERARLKKASGEAQISHLPGVQLKQLLALAQLLLKDVGRPDMDLAGLDLPAQQALLGVQVRLDSTAFSSLLNEGIGQVLPCLASFLFRQVSRWSQWDPGPCTNLC